MTFEELQKANATIRTMTISRFDKKSGKTVSKEYAEVNQRVKAFRMVCPEGIIETQLLSDEGGRCVFRATVGYYLDDGSIHVLGTGTAYEKETSSQVNQTSYIENCETSAIGRALGMAGFGIDTSIASYEEVANAIHQQENPGKLPIDPSKVAALSMLIQETGTDQTRLCESYKVKGLPELTLEQWKNAMDILTARKEKHQAEAKNAASNYEQGQMAI